MPELVLNGPANSTFVCAARLALDEKGVAYQLEQPEVIKSGSFRLADMVRYLVAQQPRLTDGDFVLFEVESILSYVDGGFEGPAL
jgi:glutathione S-transferase